MASVLVFESTDLGESDSFVRQHGMALNKDELATHQRCYYRCRLNRKFRNCRFAMTIRVDKAMGKYMVYSKGQHDHTGAPFGPKRPPPEPLDPEVRHRVKHLAQSGMSVSQIGAQLVREMGSNAAPTPAQLQHAFGAGRVRRRPSTGAATSRGGKNPATDAPRLANSVADGQLSARRRQQEEVDAGLATSTSQSAISGHVFASQSGAVSGGRRSQENEIDRRWTASFNSPSTSSAAWTSQGFAPRLDYLAQRGSLPGPSTRTSTPPTMVPRGHSLASPAADNYFDAGTTGSEQFVHHVDASSTTVEDQRCKDRLQSGSFGYARTESLASTFGGVTGEIGYLDGAEHSNDSRSIKSGGESLDFRNALNYDGSLMVDYAGNGVNNESCGNSIEALVTEAGEHSEILGSLGDGKSPGDPESSYFGEQMLVMGQLKCEEIDDTEMGIDFPPSENAEVLESGEVYAAGLYDSGFRRYANVVADNDNNNCASSSMFGDADFSGVAVKLEHSYQPTSVLLDDHLWRHGREGPPIDEDQVDNQFSNTDVLPVESGTVSLTPGEAVAVSSHSFGATEISGNKRASVERSHASDARAPPPRKRARRVIARRNAPAASFVAKLKPVTTPKTRVVDVSKPEGCEKCGVNLSAIEGLFESWLGVLVQRFDQQDRRLDEQSQLLQQRDQSLKQLLNFATVGNSRVNEICGSESQASLETGNGVVRLNQSDREKIGDGGDDSDNAVSVNHNLLVDSLKNSDVHENSLDKHLGNTADFDGSTHAENLTVGRCGNSHDPIGANWEPSCVNGGAAKSGSSTAELPAVGSVSMYHSDENGGSFPQSSRSAADDNPGSLATPKVSDVPITTPRLLEPHPCSGSHACIPDNVVCKTGSGADGTAGTCQNIWKRTGSVDDSDPGGDLAIDQILEFNFFLKCRVCQKHLPPNSAHMAVRHIQAHLSDRPPGKCPPGQLLESADVGS